MTRLAILLPLTLGACHVAPVVAAEFIVGIIDKGIGISDGVLALVKAPPGTPVDSPVHGWFESQHSVGGAWCCDLADGHEVADSDWKHDGGQYEVRIDGSWWPVPPKALRDPAGGPNPTPGAIVWYRQDAMGVPTIWCFAPGFEY